MTEHERDLQMDAWLERLVTAFERIAGSLEKMADPVAKLNGPYTVTSACRFPFVTPGGQGGAS